MSEKDYGDPVVGAMFGLCIGYYLGKGVTVDEIILLANEMAKDIVRRIQAENN